MNLLSYLIDFVTSQEAGADDEVKDDDDDDNDDSCDDTLSCSDSKRVSITTRMRHGINHTDI